MFSGVLVTEFSDLTNIITHLHELQETVKNSTWADQGTKSQNMGFLSVYAKKYKITESANLEKTFEIIHTNL